nr:hypothetical protein [Tanacetum cinerariifolium]
MRSSPKEIKEDLFISCVENGILQDSFEPSNYNTNVANALREPFVVNQDPGKNSSQSLPQINHHCCYECGDPLEDIFCHQCTYELCGNGAHYGYNCPPKVSIIPDLEHFNNQTIKEPCYNQNFNFPHDFHDFQQQYLCCENCGVTHEAYQCKPMNEDYYHEQNSFYDLNSFGFDHFQPQKYTVNHPIFNVQNDLFNSQNKLIEQLTSIRDMVGQFILKKEEEKQIEEEHAANARYWKILACYDDDDEDYTFAITPNEFDNSLSMGDEHLDTVLTMESNEFIKSSVENLVPNPSVSEDFYSVDDQSIFDEDIPKKIYLNPLFDEEIISMEIDPHHFNAKSNLIESLLNHDSSIISSSSKIDSLFDEFVGELTLLKSIPLGINETDCDPKEETHFIKRLLYDNSFPHPPKEFNSENSDGIEEDDYDSKRDILILEEFLSNDSISFLENESFYFDIPSSSRPPAKPPDGNSGILNVKIMGDISEQKVTMPRLTITLVLNQEKFHDLLSYLGLEGFQPSAECPMMIHGKNTPILDVLLFHFYPP